MAKAALDASIAQQELLVNHYWMLMCDQHLDGPVWLIAHEHRPHALQTNPPSTHQWILFMTKDAKKYSEMQHFAYNGLRWGATGPVPYIFRKLSMSWCEFLIDMQCCYLQFFRYSWSNGFFEAPKLTPFLFLVSHMVTPKDIITNRGRRPFQTIDLQLCKISRRLVTQLPRYVPGQKDTHTHTYLKLNIWQNTTLASVG